MSAQSIYIQTIDTVKEQLEKDILKQAKNFLYHKRFMLGKGVNKKQRNHALMAMSYICTENCELIRYINKTLKGCDVQIETDINSTYHLYIANNLLDLIKKLNLTSIIQDEECVDCVNWENKEW